MAKREKQLWERVSDLTDKVFPYPSSEDWVRMNDAQRDENREIRALVFAAIRRGVRLGRYLEKKKHGKA